MFARLISITLIVALIACPLGCGNGFCQGDQGRSSHFSANSINSCVAENLACCPKSAVSINLPNDRAPNDGAPNDGAPKNQPCDTSCAGICGGAVLEKPFDFSGTDAGFSNFDAIDHQTTRHPNDSNIRDIHQRILPRDGNPGRSLRTLHQSLLI